MQGGRGRRLPRHRRARRAGPPDVPLPDLRRHGPTRCSAVVVVAVTDAVTVDQPPVARADVVEVRAGGKVNVPVLENDYDPEGGALEVVVGHAVRGRRRGAGPQRPDRRRARRRRRDLQLHAQLHRRRRGRQPVERLPRGAHRAGRRGQPAADRPHRHRPHAQRRAGARSRSSPTTPTPTATSSPSRTSAPSRPAAPPRVEDGAVVYTPSDTFAGTDRFTLRARRRRWRDRHRRGARRRDAAAPARTGPRRRSTTTSQAVAGSAPLVFDVLDNDSDPDGDRVHVTTVGTPASGAAEVAEDGGARRVHPAGRRSAPRTSTEIAFTYSIDDGRGGTASATVTVEVIAAGERDARPIAVDDLVGPLAPGQSVERRPARQRPRPRRQPGRARRRLRRPGARRPRRRRRSRSPPARRRAATSTRSPTPPGSPTRPRSTCSSCPTGRRSSRPFTGADPGQRGRSPSTSAAQAVDPDGDTLYFACCDNPQGGAATTVANGAGELTRVVRPRRRLRRAGDVRLHRRRPAGPQRRRRGDDRGRSPPTNRPPAATDGDVHRRGRHHDEHRPRRRSSPIPTPTTR